MADRIKIKNTLPTTLYLPGVWLRDLKKKGVIQPKPKRNIPPKEETVIEITARNMDDRPESLIDW